jgi:hypothetical protein
MYRKDNDIQIQQAVNKKLSTELKNFEKFKKENNNSNDINIINDEKFQG